MALDNKKITVWSTKLVDDYDNDIENGIERKESPYFYGDRQLRKPNLLYEYTKEEVELLLKCKMDINYFANNFAYTMNPSTGALNLITLRDYQENLLNTINNNRYTVIVAARQSGKCVSYNTKIETVDGLKTIGSLFSKKSNNVVLNFVHNCLCKLYALL